MIPLIDTFSAAVANEALHVQKREQQTENVAALSGTLPEEHISSIMARALAKRVKEEQKNKKDTKRFIEDILLQALLDHIEELNREIKAAEAELAAKHGDAWREELALKILDEDEIPLQKEGESIEDYRERLGNVLVAEMLNEDGTIKDQYKNDPAMRDYAEWAQMVYHRDLAVDIANDLKGNELSHPQSKRLLDELETRRNSELNLSTANELEGHEAQKGAVLAVDDRNDVSVQQQARTAQDALSFTQ